MSGAGKVGPGALPFTSLNRGKPGKPDEFLDRTLFIAIEVTKWPLFGPDRSLTIAMVVGSVVNDSDGGYEGKLMKNR